MREDSRMYTVYFTYTVHICMYVPYPLRHRRHKREGAGEAEVRQAGQGSEGELQGCKNISKCK